MDKKRSKSVDKKRLDLIFTVKFGLTLLLALFAVRSLTLDEVILIVLVIAFTGTFQTIHAALLEAVEPVVDS